MASSKASNLKMLSREGDDKNDSTDDRESDVGIPLHGLNLGGRKKLLVIDLNGLLAHTFFTFENVKIPANRRPDGVLGTKLVFKRPFCDEFLKFCFETFEVGIWSTATQRNVDGVITFIFGDFKPKLQFTWNQTHCTSTLFKTLEKKDKPIFLKELKKLWDKECHSLPWPKGRYSSSNTLLIDDSPYKALFNPPNTAIFPPKFTVDQIEDNSLGPKGDLRAFLKGLAATVDVQTYVKAHPYGQDAITANHPDWSYYSKIVGHFPHCLSH
ncbi:hypothetical protein CKAN_00138400 [Cinnamomum micranthum f. kanehirae]|uniref:Mitochondrial import inner membrane translocase subunit TIM50 n=1 Tax=Cinnamomum micranthum f. kanehirae TaxID=337451 RepID=A0A3S3MG41_9MAGN|nr:hypothetical protein CKAN_00138400 [Cinnamomum micranthum f. kanehirae]